MPFTCEKCNIYNVFHQKGQVVKSPFPLFESVHQNVSISGLAVLFPGLTEKRSLDIPDECLHSLHLCLSLPVSTFRPQPNSTFWPYVPSSLNSAHNLFHSFFVIPVTLHSRHALSAFSHAFFLTLRCPCSRHATSSLAGGPRNCC